VYIEGTSVVVFRSLTIMLVVVSTYSLLATIPKLISTILNPLNDGITDIRSVGPYFFYRWAVDIIAPWNYCGNFFLYVLSGKQFRQEILLLFLCCCRKRAPGSFVFNVFFLKVSYGFNFLRCTYQSKQSKCSPRDCKTELRW